MGGDPKSNFGGSGSRPNPALTQQTPNLFQAAQQHMPASYFGNQPINDPTAILNAYMQNLPAFLASTRSQNSVVPPPAPAPVPPVKAGNPNNPTLTTKGNGAGLRNLFAQMQAAGQSPTQQ